jgi:hypothetical protein
MLKINENVSQDGGIVLDVEGRVIGPWVDELDRSCAGALARGVTVALDLACVSFVDHRGIALLDRLGARDVTLVNCPRFVAEQLQAWAEGHRS